MTQSSVNVNFHPSKGTLLAGNGTGVVSELSVGTNDQIFTADSGEATGLKWATLSSGGAWNYISSATASNSATLVFTSGLDSTYDQYVFTMVDMVPDTDNVDMFVRTSSNGGVSYDSGSSDYTGGVSSISLTNNNIGNATGELFNAFFYLYNPSNSSLWTGGLGQNGYAQASSGVLVSQLDGGARSEAAIVDAIQFFMSSGNITSGAIHLYGISDS